MGWFSKKKKFDDDDGTKERFVSALKYGTDVTSMYRKQIHLDLEASSLWEQIRNTDTYKEAIRKKEEADELQRTYRKIIAEKHGIDLTYPNYLYIDSRDKRCQDSPFDHHHAYARHVDDDWSKNNRCIFCAEYM